MLALLATVVLGTGALGLAPGIAPGWAQSLEVPKNDGWVTDLAGVLSADEERSLETLMESYKSGTTHEIAVLVIPTIGGASLERTSLEVAREWGIGGAETSNGALLLVSTSDRKMRIEVGRGLEGNLTDLIAGRIIRDVIAPEFRSHGYYPGIRAGVEAMHAAIGGDYGPVERRRRGPSGDGQGLLVLIVFGVIAFMMLVNALTARGRYRRYREGGGSSLFWTWLLLSSMSSGRRSWGGGSTFGGLGGGGGFSGFGGGGGFSGGGASGGW